MPTSQATSILREITNSKPISEKTRAFQRRRLQNRFYRFILKTFKEQQKNGLTQKELAERIHSRPEQINRWLSIPGNLTLNTIADLLLGMGVDLDDPSSTPLTKLVEQAERPAEAVKSAKLIVADFSPQGQTLAQYNDQPFELMRHSRRMPPQPLKNRQGPAYGCGLGDVFQNMDDETPKAAMG